jgi:hypothetical protein
MGNSLASNQGPKATFSILLDHEQPGKNVAFVAGHSLTGRLVVHVRQKLPPSTFVLHLVGKEKTKVYSKNENSDSESRKPSGQTFFGERTIISVNLVLRQDARGPITPNLYSMPFEIMLPNTLPCTMEDGGYQNKFTLDAMNHIPSGWKIQYKLSASATFHGKRPICKLGQRYVNIASAPLPDEQVPALIEPASHKVASIGLFKGMSKGVLTIAAKVLDVHVGRGLEVQLFLAVRNDSTKNIEQVHASLIEEIRWNARGRWSSKKIAVSSLGILNLPGILRPKQDKGVVRQQLSDGRGVSQVTYNHLDGIYRDLCNQENLVKIPIPWDCRDSFKGSLVQVHHRLEVTFFTKASNPNISIPLQIGHAPNQTVPTPNAAASASIPVVSPTASRSHEPFGRFSPFHPPAINPESSQLPPLLSTVPAVPIMGYSDIPMVHAVILPIDTSGMIQAPRASATTEAMILGGNPQYSQNENGSSFPPPAPFVASSMPSLANLLEEMMFSIDDYDIICNKLNDPNWVQLLAKLTPDDFGRVLAHVNRDSDQPRIAEMLALHVAAHNPNTWLTCRHVVLAAINAADWNKTNTIQRILPHCSDLVENYGQIQQVLSDWEWTVLKSDVEQLLSERHTIYSCSMSLYPTERKSNYFTIQYTMSSTQTNLYEPKSRLVLAITWEILALWTNLEKYREINGGFST